MVRHNKNRKIDQNNDVTRKDKRKMLRKQKKQKRNAFYQKNYINKQQNKQQPNAQKNQIKPINKNNIKSQTTLPIKQKQVKPQKQKLSQLDQLIQNDQKQIKFYQKQLGLNSKKYKGIAKGLGYDDDLFDFLDNISKKVKKSDNIQYPQQQQVYSQQLQDQQQDQDQNQSQQDQSQNDQSQSDQQGLEEQPDLQQNQQSFSGNQNDQQLFDQALLQHMNQQPWGQQINEENNQISQQQDEKFEESQQSMREAFTRQVKSQRRPLFIKASSKEQVQRLQIRKQMNGLLNKLSDGNIMITFREFQLLFSTYSRSNTISTYTQLFIKFNIQTQKPHLHILLSNIAILSALHHLIGNRLMGPLLYHVVKRFSQLEIQPEDQEEVREIGYSKGFQRRKNVVLLVCYLYQFKSLTGEFIETLVAHLVANLNQYNIQFLYLIIQKIGVKIRTNDPAILKNILQNLKKSIETYKLQRGTKSEKSKIDIIQVQLNQLKFNRKKSDFLDQRLQFLYTFINKNIPKQIGSQKQILLLNFNTIKSVDISHTNWWDMDTNNHYMEEQNQIVNQVNTQKRYLVDLAKSLNLVTEIRKNIFLEIMQAEDYVEATQRVLALKIKNLQEIALVLVQVGMLQPTFNPFYPLVASKIAQLMPKFKSKIQFTIWDQLKVLQSFQARKVVNLSKFLARFISSPLSDGSLSMLKYYSDLINIHPQHSMFLLIFFRQFFKIVKKQKLVSISQKLNQDSNQAIKNNILLYFNTVGLGEKGFGYLDKMKFLRRLIVVNNQRKLQKEDF